MIARNERTQTQRPARNAASSGVFVVQNEEEREGSEVWDAKASTSTDTIPPCERYYGVWRLERRMAVDGILASISRDELLGEVP